MPEIDEPTDNPSQRVADLLERTGTVHQMHFSEQTDLATLHAADPIRQDPANANLNWRPLGPRNLGGRIRCLAQDERNPQTFYAGSARAGLWRTKDRGDSWTALDYFSPPNARQSLAVGAIGVSYSNPEIIYVGTGEPTRTSDDRRADILGNGLYRSSDNGKSFIRIDHPLTGDLKFGQYERIIVDPWEPNRIWIASSDGGIGRSVPSAENPRQLILKADQLVHASSPANGSQRATDILVDFGPSRTTPPDIVTVYVALLGNGIYRAQYSRNQERYLTAAGVTWTPITPGFPAGFTRIKISHCRTQPNWICAVAGLADDSASHVFISDDRGSSWIDTSARLGDIGDHALYDLVLEMHPLNPSIFITGSFELFKCLYVASAPAANRFTWSKIIDWEQHYKGDRAQHADQHALLFDYANPMSIWVGNDGGVSASSDLGDHWRDRGLGINAAQFNDITTHPKYPYIYAGGLLDNGTWLSYGGQTWFLVGGGDGGEVAFNPDDPRVFLRTTQNGTHRVTIINSTDDFGTQYFMTQLPDVPKDGDKDVNHMAIGNKLVNNFHADHKALFVGVMDAHPVKPNHIIVGREETAYHTIDGDVFEQFNNIPAFTNTTNKVTKVLHSPQTPDLIWWVTTSHGQVFVTNDADATTWDEVSPSELRGQNATITGIAINTSNESIVAISVTIRVSASEHKVQGRIYLSGDSGQNWLEISGRIAPCVSSPDNQFSPSAAIAILFDPTSSASVTDPQVIYCACFAGVYVIRNAVAPTVPTPVGITPFAPQWRTFNNNLPLPLVFDLEAVTYTNSAGEEKHLIRCATHSRGAYECDLSGVARVKLIIRDNIVDDGNSYDPKHKQPLNHDPRMTPGNTAIMVLNRAIDIRIDTPPYRFFGPVIEGTEMDELLRSDELSACMMNIIYVQLHNNGYGITNSAELHLFWATVPATPPDLQADFWTQFPNVLDGGTWQKIDSVEIDYLASGQPRVMAFNWHVPGELTGNVALLAVASDSIHDPLDISVLGNVVDPAQAASFIGQERRTALFISPVTPSPANASMRDGFDDTGLLGETAWGTQSHDIIVVQAAQGDPDTAFADMNDKRIADVLDGSETNHIYVRARNQGGTALNNAEVEVFRIPVSSLQDPNSWVSIGTATLTTIAAKSSAIFPAITWANPPDPAPDKCYILIALIQGDEDARPDFITRVMSIQTFWKLLLEDADSGNAVVRGLNWQP